MGNVMDYVLTVPPVGCLTDEVAEGLEALGFRLVSDDRTVWVRLDQKLWSSLGAPLEVLVPALPWRKVHVPVYLEVLWRDEHTDGDDGWGGRTGPFGWNHETWPLP